VTLYAFDGASPFDLAAAKKAGAVLITGYIAGHPGGMNPIDKARVDQIRAMGMGFLPNWEKGAAYLVTCSRADGVAAGREAVVALRALGVPDDGTVACPFSWDTWIDPSRYAHCGQVADGIIEGLAGHYRFSAYGQGGLIDYLTTSGRMQAEGWLSGSTGFPGYNATDTRVALVQHAGHTPVPGTDLDTVTDPYHVGAWWPDGSPYGVDMPLTAADAALVWASPILLDDGKTKWQAAHLLKRAYTEADAAGTAVTQLAARVTTLEQILGGTDTQPGVAPRVAQVQAALTQVQAALAAMSPAEQEKLDADMVASKVLAALNGATLNVNTQVQA